MQSVLAHSSFAAGAACSLQAAGAPRPQAFTARPLSRRALRLQRLTVRAQEESEDDFEARIAALKRGKGETPYGETRKEGGKEKPKAAPSKKVYDYTNETLHLETGPHGGDLAINLALGATLVWLPLSAAAVGRAAFVKYRFTDRRISVTTDAPWQKEALEAAYQEVKDVVTIGRGIGLWGDMVVTLRDGSKIELRAVPQHRELQAYILARRDALTGGGSGGAGSSERAEAKGFA